MILFLFSSSVLSVLFIDIVNNILSSKGCVRLYPHRFNKDPSLINLLEICAWIIDPRVSSKPCHSTFSLIIGGISINIFIVLLSLNINLIY